MSATTETKLLSCPFCGGLPGLRDYDAPRAPAYIECDSCNVTLEAENGHVHEAIAAWNSRANHSADAGNMPSPHPMQETHESPKVVAWQHTFKLEGHTENDLSISSSHPFGRPGRDYSESAQITSSPLITLSDHSAAVKKLEGEIERLRHDVDSAGSLRLRLEAMRQSNSALTQKLDRAMEALKPLAAVVDEGWASSHQPEVELTLVWNPDYAGGKRVPVGDFRRARAALVEIEKNG